MKNDLKLLFFSFANICKKIYVLCSQVNDLRQELMARNLSSKGLKSQLLARLVKTIKSEQAKEEGRQDEADENEEDVSPPSKEEDDKKFRDSKDVSGMHTCKIRTLLKLYICHANINYVKLLFKYFSQSSDTC